MIRRPRSPAPPPPPPKPAPHETAYSAYGVAWEVLGDEKKYYYGSLLSRTISLRAIITPDAPLTEVPRPGVKFEPIENAYITEIQTETYRPFDSKILTRYEIFLTVQVYP